MRITVSIVEDQREFRQTLQTLMEICLPKLSGIECVVRLKAQLPKTQFVMLTVVEDSEPIFEALRSGATGYLIKGAPLAEIMDAIGDVHCGGSPMSSAIARKVVRYFHQLRPASPALDLITKREQEVLKLLAEGKRYQQIAQSLGVSPFTIRAHIRNIYEKLQVHSRTEAVVKFLRE